MHGIHLYHAWNTCNIICFHFRTSHKACMVLLHSFNLRRKLVKSLRILIQYTLLNCYCQILLAAFYDILIPTSTCTGRRWMAVRDLCLEKVEETVLIRTRVHNRRGTGGCAWIGALSTLKLAHPIRNLMHVTCTLPALACMLTQTCP